MNPSFGRLAAVVCCFVVAGAPVGAQVASPQQADPRVHAPGLVRALDATPLTRPAFRLPALDSPLTFTEWLADRRAALAAALLPEARVLAQVRLARHAPPAAAPGLLEFAPREAAPGDAAREAEARRLATTPQPADRGAPGSGLDGLVELTDLGVRVRGSGDFGGAWTRHRPCDPGLILDCRPGVLPQLRPDLQLAVQAGGTISERVHVDVDYDQAREFDAANSISVRYQGLPHEVLQRIEVGDVFLRLPSSRYLTRGVPAGNFGLMASAQLGPVEVQTLVAQQKGEVTTREFRIGGDGRDGLEQEATLALDDADYAAAQFFFLAEPRLLRAYPHIDALQLRATDAPPHVRPAAGGPIELYRDERFASGAQTGYFLAEAALPDGGERHTGRFRRLLPDEEYVVHGSGLWVMLRSPLRADEALAVAYLAESGDTTGTLRPESVPPGTSLPQLRLLRGPLATHHPGAGTWPLEMRQVYRIDSSSDVDAAGVDLRISLGELSSGQAFRTVAGRQLSFLKFFGLDEDTPADRLDPARVFQPARDAFGGGDLRGGGTFIILPTLRPFAEPAPLPSVRLSAADLQSALGRDANLAIYDATDPVTRAASGRFRLTFTYRVVERGSLTSFSLGAIGIREGSERLYLGSRLLERNVDYAIDYDLGVVMLPDAHALLGSVPGGEIRATWEQKSLFAVAPTTMLGASARYDLGPRGELNLVGLYQAERSLLNRPQLGAEASAALVGGLSGRFDLGGAALDRLVSAVAGARGSAPSRAVITGELALSVPDPNRRGAAYLDDFEASDVLPLSPRRQEWRLGSAPQSAQGDRGTLPHVIDATTAAPLVWQHDVLHEGRVAGGVTPGNIDRQISIVGAELAEPVLWLTFGRDAGVASPLPDPGEARRWRSMTTVLASTGHDLSRAEYLEFYVSARHDEPMALILDLGTVGEDAFYIDAAGRTGGTRADGTRWGLGVLDEEASTLRQEVWGPHADARGLWDGECEAEPLVAYPLGDARANCTRGNGIDDTEDLNGNGVLDPDDGPLFRFVVQLDRASEYLVRDTAETGTGYRLYRIPLRSGTPLHGADDASWRFIRHLRLTVAGEPAGARTLALARLRIVGSRWLKRDGHGIQRGLLDAAPGAGAAHTQLRVGPVSRVTDGAAYAPPPGVTDQLQDPAATFGIGAHEINTRSLRIAYDGLEPDDRAEVYFRYPQQPRNLLAYRELRLWVLPREGRWGAAGDERFTVRIGSDPHNYYLFQTPLRAATGPRAAAPADWMPELVIDFRQWWALKAEAERLLIERGPRTAGADTLWSPDSTYALVLQDRATAPNLAAVRELVFAVWNGGASTTSGEVWVDELRVAGPDRDPGGAGSITLDLAGGGLVNTRISLASQGARYRQLGEVPQYVGGTDFMVATDVHLDAVLPAAWALDLPLSVMHTRNAQTPVFLQQSDVVADRLDGLRDSGHDLTRVGLRISRREPLPQPVLGMLVDGTEVRLAYDAGSWRTPTGATASGGFRGDIVHRRDPVRRDVAALPRVFGAALRAIAPAGIEESDAFRRLVRSRLRWSPSLVSAGVSYSDQLMRTHLHERIIALPDDSLPPAIESPRQALRSDATIALQPFQRLDARLAVTSERDLLPAARASTVPREQDALAAARGDIAGVDLGWETARLLHATLGYRPELTRWLRAAYGFDNRHRSDRNAGYMHIAASDVDTTAHLQRRFESVRQQTRSLTLHPRGLVLALVADSTARITALAAVWESIDASWRTTTASHYDRSSLQPRIGYQLGLGGLDAFRFAGRDTATGAYQRSTFDLTGVFVPVRDARLEIGYRDTHAESFAARGGTRSTRELAWPRAGLVLRTLPVPALLQRVVTSLGASAGVQRIERTQFSGAAADRRATELNFPLSLSLGLQHGVALNYRGSWSAGETLDPAGTAEAAGFQQTVTLTGSLPAPARWTGRMTGPVIVALSYANQQQRQCRFQPLLATHDGCSAFLDLGTRSGSARVETRLADLDVGLLFHYVARRNRVGLRNGSDQFQLGIYGRFDLAAGHLLPPRQPLR